MTDLNDLTDLTPKAGLAGLARGVAVLAMEGRRDRYFKHHTPTHFFYTDGRGVRRKQTIPMWTLDQAVAFINELLPDARAAGWNLALNGSVLYKGQSDNDVDVIAHPMVKRGVGLIADTATEPYELLLAISQTLQPSVDDLRAVLVKHGLRPKWTVEEVHDFWRKAGSLDEKHVEVWLWTGVWRADAGHESDLTDVWTVKRVDLFIMR